MSQIISKKLEALGTIIEISLEKKNSVYFDLCFEEIKRIEKKYSRFDDNSYISYLNSNLNKKIILDEETLFLFKKYEYLKLKTEGFFNIFLKKTLEDLGYDKDYSFKKKFKGFFPFKKKIFYNLNNLEIVLFEQIDFGGFGKGYAVDRIRDILGNLDVNHFMINAGGDIFANNAYDENNNWNVVLENPNNLEYAFAKINLNNFAICSSSSNKRKWKKYHHLINPFTNKPANDMKAVYVFDKDTINADAYATALFVSGFDKAIEISKKENISVLLISNQNKIYQSPNLDLEYF